MGIVSTIPGSGQGLNKDGSRTQAAFSSCFAELYIPSSSTG